MQVKSSAALLMPERATVSCPAPNDARCACVACEAIDGDAVLSGEQILSLGTDLGLDEDALMDRLLARREREDELEDAA